MADSSSPTALLQDWLSTRLTTEASDWLSAQTEKVKTDQSRGFYLAFGMTPRKVGKSDLKLSTEELASANNARENWNPADWTIDQATRTLLVLSLPADDPDALVKTLDRLFEAADVGELVALYQMLPVLPFPEAHLERAAEGVRTNIKAILCAVAHYNPYPSEYLNELAWNQMVLKCLFVGAILDPIHGLDERANVTLMRMLIDYAHERWSANRAVSPELWRCVGPYADEAALKELHKVLTTGTPLEQQAATLALMSCDDPEAKNILLECPDMMHSAEKHEYTWRTIAEAILEQ